MFEKEAEEWANKIYPSDGQAQRYLLMGAMFGYNKANEWHYVKDGDLPKNNIQVLVLLENERLKTSIFMENKFTVWNKDYKAYTKLYNVIAWKEIILPKEVKEK